MLQGTRVEEVNYPDIVLGISEKVLEVCVTVREGGIQLQRVHAAKDPHVLLLFEHVANVAESVAGQGLLQRKRAGSRGSC